MRTLETVLPWFMSAGTIAVMLLAGRKHRATWYVALTNQVVWSCWIVMVKAWGLIPGAVALWIVYADNLRRWRRSE